MAVITRAYSEVTGQIAYASSINKIINDLYTLQDGNIGLGNIANSGVGGTAISDSAVITAKLGPSAVTTAKIKNSAITSAKIADSAVVTIALGPCAVTSAKIADSAIIGSSAIAGTANISYDRFNDATLPSASLWTMQRLFLEGF